MDGHGEVEAVFAGAAGDVANGMGAGTAGAEVEATVGVHDGCRGDWVE